MLSDIKKQQTPMKTLKILFRSMSVSLFCERGRDAVEVKNSPPAIQIFPPRVHESAMPTQ